MSKGRGAGTSRANGFKVKLLLLSLGVGGVVTVIALLVGPPWLFTILLLITLYLVCRALPAAWAPVAYSLYAAFAIFWLTGTVLDGLVQALLRGQTGIRLIVPDLLGFTLAVAVPILFWQLVISTSATWVLAISDSLGVSIKEARQFVRSQVFRSARNYLIVENGEIVSEKPAGILSRLGGPGVLVIRPGNAVVLERGGKTTRVVGPGMHTLERFETIKKPHAGKGIIDLRPQERTDTLQKVLTKDGIPLTIEVSQSWRIEPKDVTDNRRPSMLAGGAPTADLLGAPEHPVYETTVRKAVFGTPAAGWTSTVPERGLSVLRDVVATCTLDEILPVNPKTSGHGLVVRQIEQDVKKNYDSSAFGVEYLGIDIRHMDVPDDIRDQLVRRWKAPLERQVRLVQARAEREALIELSEGRAQALDNLEGAKLSARANMARMVTKIIEDMVQQHNAPVAVGFVDLVRELSERIGQDEQVALRYIEAVQAVISGEGAKSFVFNPPYPGPAAMPPPAPLSATSSGGGSGGGTPPQDEDEPQTVT